MVYGRREPSQKMIKTALKNTGTKIVTVIFLCSLVIFLSAFTSDLNTLYMTRLDMAYLMEEILNDASISSSNYPLPKFTDLSEERRSSLEKVLKHKIMNGYEDGSFRPNAPMRNLEVIAYLQRLNSFLRKSNPESKSTKLLFRFLSYNEDPSFALERGYLDLIQGKESPNSITSKETFTELFNKLTIKGKSQYILLCGKIVDSLSGNPVEKAFISVNHQALAADEKGCFTFTLAPGQKKAEVFAAAEGYLPTELCKDLNMGNNLIIRLRPSMEQERRRKAPLLSGLQPDLYSSQKRF